jgi:hypothetical protein
LSLQRTEGVEVAIIPTNLYAALNGIAAAAKTANDPNTISLVTQMAEMASFGLAAYTATGTQASPAVIPVDFYTVPGLGVNLDSSVLSLPAGTAGSPW